LSTRFFWTESSPTTAAGTAGTRHPALAPAVHAAYLIGGSGSGWPGGSLTWATFKVIDTAV